MPRQRFGGKLFLAGEYGVLHPGGRGVLVPTPDILAAHLEQSSKEEVILVPTMDAPVTWEEALTIPALAPALAAFHELRAGITLRGPKPARLVLDRLDDRPGLGSSAAMALAATILGWKTLRRPRLTDQAYLHLAMEAHQRAQGGVGSGADVAAIMERAPLLFHAAPRGSHPPLLVHLPWPRGWSLVAAWTSRHTPTRQLVAQVTARLGTLDKFARAFRARSDAYATSLATALRDADPDLALAAITHAGELLGELADRCQAPLVVSEAAKLMAAVQHVPNVATKISGAGGGDAVIALATTPEAREEVVTIWRSSSRSTMVLDGSW